MTIREIADKLDAAWLCCEERATGASYRLCVRYDERCAGVRDGGYAAAHRYGEQPVRAYLRDAGRALRNLCAKQGAAGGCAGIGEEIGLPMLKTPYTMFESCARLYTAGLKPVELG